MKIAVGMMLLATMLAGSAYAAEPGAPATTSLSKDLPVQSAPPAPGKKKSPGGKKAKSAAKKVAPKAKMKMKSVMETPAESADQSVQLKGVRG